MVKVAARTGDVMGRVTSGGSRIRVAAILLATALALPAFAAETTQYSYDALGRVLSAIDASGRKVVYTYDATGNRTRVSNGSEFAEIIPTGFSASSNAGTTGLTATNGMRDGAFLPLASIHATQSETNAWVQADLGSIKNVNHIDVMAAIESSVGATPDDLNDTAVEYSIDGTTWRSAATLSGVAPAATRTLALGGVSLRYLRIRRTVTGQVALGELRFYSAAAANSPLIAEPDSITSQGSAVTFDPRANDRDLDGHSFTVSAAEDPPHGQVTVNGGTSLTYTSDPGYFGGDGFGYTIADGYNGIASARVTVLVNSSTNHAPVAVDDTLTVSDRASAIVDGINALRPLGNDYDADGDVLTITSKTTPSHGTLTLVGGNLLEYQATTGYSGADSFSYTISDGRGGTATAAVNLTSGNTDPIARPDRINTSKGQSVTFDPRLNDTDPNGDTITIASVATPALGTATLNSNQTITYVPNTNATGVDNFSYTLGDGRSGTATGSIVATISTNTAPVAAPDSFSAVASTPVVVDPRANDSDPDGDLITVVAVTAPAHGTASISDGGTAVTYTMAGGYSGSDSLSYTISDPSGATGTATMAINSLAVQYLVVAGGGAGGSGQAAAGGGAGGVRQGSLPLTLTGYAVTVGAGATTAGGGGQNSSIGSLVVALGGGGAGGSGGSGGGGARGYQSPGAGTSGQGYAGGTGAGAAGGGGGAGGAGLAANGDLGGAGGPGVNSDISGTLTNYAAGGGAGGYIDEDPEYSISVGAAGGASGGAGSYSSAAQASAPSNRGGGGGGSGGAGGSGIVIVRYRGAAKATGGTITSVGGDTIHTFTASGTMTPTAGNSQPVAVTDSITAKSGVPKFFDPRANDTDVDGDSLVVAFVGPASHGATSLNSAGAPVIYTPVAGYTGGDSFSYTVSDGSSAVAGTVNVTVSSGGVALEYLVVAGGGGGGAENNARSGGGGGGGVRTGTLSFPSGSYPITIGGGGAGGSSSNWANGAAKGGDSSLGGLVTSIGGGAGGTYGLVAGSGGSGGGGARAPGGRGTSGQGYSGGDGYINGDTGGGGGGAGGAGARGWDRTSGSGGPGLTSSISGAAVVYGAGGGGGGFAAQSATPTDPGGADSGGGVGGPTAFNVYSGGAGTTNRGGGGGGGGINYGNVGPGGAGGSGIVVIRYPTGALSATGGTVTTSGGYTIHTFTANGTFTVP